MQGIAILIGVITRLILVVGLIYIFYKVGKFLDILPDVLVKRKEKEEKE
ncbi:MAG: hypothetical protein HXS46_03390 [Theionarchaea archaeon]|nr:hypothetical protein [Theionarchaea archaeon]